MRRSSKMLMPMCMGDGADTRHTFIEINEHDKDERRCKRNQDAAFCAAMLRAVEQEQEHPPMIGVDARPGTRQPKLVTAAVPLSR